MLEQTDVNDKKYEDKIEEQVKEAAKVSQFGRLSAMSEPKINIFIGIVFSLINACLQPAFSIFLSKSLSTLTVFQILKDVPGVKEESRTTMNH
jgi:hypothetical protein